MGKRANIRATARNTRTLVAYAQRDELVARGLIPPTASVGQAQAAAVEFQRQQLAAQRAEAREDRVANASPGLSALLIFVFPVPFAIIALASGVGFWWLVTFVVAIACVLGFCVAVNDTDAKPNATP